MKAGHCPNPHGLRPANWRAWRFDVARIGQVQTDQCDPGHVAEQRFPPEELNAYLTNYPNGTFKSIALARIASLQNGPSTATRNLTTGSGIDPQTFSEDASQVTEDQLGLDRSQRRDVQRRLTSLGFDVKASGKFDDATRTVITRWQAARGYPKSGYLNALQHKALQSEILATRVASTSSDDSDDEPSHPSRHHGGGGGGRHYHRGGGGPGAFFGGMMGGLFRH